MNSACNTSSFASEDTPRDTKLYHSASILAEKDDLKRIKIEMMASNERNETADEYLVEHELSPFMAEVVKRYKKLLDQQSATINKQAKRLMELSSSDCSLKRAAAVRRAVVNSLVDKVARYKSNEQRLECRLTESEKTRRYAEDELAAAKSELAGNDCRIKELYATVLEDERKVCSMHRQLDECIQECTGLHDAVAKLNAELKCKSDELDNERLHADRLNETLEYERQNHCNESKMSGKRVRDIQLRCDELSCQLNEEKTETMKLTARLLDAGKTCGAGDRPRPPSPPPSPSSTYFEEEHELKRKIEDLRTECETKDARIKALKNKLNAATTTTTTATSDRVVQCCSTCNLPKVDKSCCTDDSSSSSASLATTVTAGSVTSTSTDSSSTSTESTATTTQCDDGNAANPADKHQADVQRLLKDLHSLSRDVKTICIKHI